MTWSLAVSLRPDYYFYRPGTRLNIKETGAPEACEDVASVEACPSDDIAAGATASGAGSVLSLLPQADKMGSPTTSNKIACSSFSIWSSD